MESVSQELARFAVETKFEDLPEDVVHEAKRGLLDSIGCAIAGITTEKGKMAIQLAKRLGGPPESSIMGMGGKVSCSNAAFANGELINALDYDAMPHLHLFVVPPSLAVAESIHASGQDVILATVLGQEISRRISSGLSGMMEKLLDGLKPLTVWGNGNHCIFGATAGTGKILKLGEKEMTHALGIAGYLTPVPAAGKWDTAVPKPIIKYTPVGWICSSAVTAALIAEMGYSGDTSVFDGDYGFWRFYSSEKWNPDAVLDKIGKRWLFTSVHYKVYPCCSFLHSQLDCFISIIEKNHLMPEDIDSVKTYGLPLYASPKPMEVSNQVDAQFSRPYVLALAAHRIKIGADWQDFDMIRNLRIQEFMKKVSFQVHPGAGEAKHKDPRSWLAKVEVAARGKTFVEERMYARGTAVDGFKLTDEDLMEKFRGNVSRRLTEDKIDKAIKSLLQLESIEDITELTKRVAL